MALALCLIFVVSALSIVASLHLSPVNAQTTPPTFLVGMSTPVTNSTALGYKPVMLNGSRYVVTTAGWGATTSAVYIFNATSTWAENGIVATLPFVAADIYAQTFPSYSNSTIFVYGHNGSKAFLSTYNVTSSSWTVVNDTTDGYITDVGYVNGNFYMNAANNGYVWEATPANLFTFGSWTQITLPSFPTATMEPRFTFLNSTVGFISQDNRAYYTTIWRWNLTDNTFTLMANDSDTSSTLSGYYCDNIGAYNGVVAYSAENSSGVPHFDEYYSLDAGTTWTWLTSFPIIPNGGGETQNFIIPYNSNTFIVSSVGGQSDTGAIWIVYANGTRMQGMGGIGDSDSATDFSLHPVIDGTNWVFGGEGSVAAGPVHVKVIAWNGTGAPLYSSVQASYSTNDSSTVMPTQPIGLTADTTYDQALLHTYTWNAGGGINAGDSFITNCTSDPYDYPTFTVGIWESNANSGGTWVYKGQWGTAGWYIQDSSGYVDFIDGATSTQIKSTGTIGSGLYYIAVSVNTTSVTININGTDETPASNTFTGTLASGMNLISAAIPAILPIPSQAHSTASKTIRPTSRHRTW